MQQTKLSQVQAAMRAGEWQRAIGMAARFPDLGAQRRAILDAHGAFTNPRFAAQVGDVEEMKARGIQAMRAKYER